MGLSKVMRRGARWRAATLLAAVSLAGCGGAATTVDDTKSNLVVASEDIARGLDIDGASSVQQATQSIIWNLMEPLINYPVSEEGDVQIPNYQSSTEELEPRLAETWTQDGQEWTLKLREGVKSCAGNEFTADDVIYTIARAKSVSGATPLSWFMNNAASVLPLDPLKPEATDADKELKDEVVKVDDYTVRFKQANTNELFPRNLALLGLLIFDSKEVEKHATPDDPWSHRWVDTQDTPGFGPYCLESWTKGQEMRLKANPNYYRGTPQFETVVVRNVGANANRVAAVQSGSADIAINLTPREYAELDKNPNVSVLSWQNNVGVQLGLSANFAPWNGEKERLVRQAVAHAIPYDEIIAEDYLGEAERWGGLCPSSSFGYAEQPLYETDLEKAERLLAEAGYPGGRGLPADGLTMHYPAERRALLDPIAARIRTSLAKIGITIELAPIAQAEYGDRKINKYDMPMFIEDQDRPLMPDVGYCSLLFFVSKENGGVNTPFAYDNPEFDALYATSAGTVGEERTAAMTEMQEILMRDLPAIPIAEPASQIAVRAGITGWRGTAYDTLSYFEFKTE